MDATLRCSNASMYPKKQAAASTAMPVCIKNDIVNVSRVVSIYGKRLL